LKAGAKVCFRQASGKGEAATLVEVSGVTRPLMESVALEIGLSVRAEAARRAGETNSQTRSVAAESQVPVRQPRIGLYQPWTANMDEGWTRWLLEQYEFPYATLHNSDIKAGNLADRFDAIVLPDQQPKEILGGLDFKSIRPEYRGGIGDDGVTSLRNFVRSGGTLIALGLSSGLAIEKFPIPVRDLKKGLGRDQHFGPGAILRIEVDTKHPIGYGMPADTYGFYLNGPFLALDEGFGSQHSSVIVRYPNADVPASGWLKGEELMAGRAAVVASEIHPGRIVLFGLRPQHRAKTEATFPLLFNALYYSTM
jgi:hypothetical protein